MYQQLTYLCSTLSVNPALQDLFTPRIELLQVYGDRICHTHYSKHQMNRLGKGPVSQVLGVIAATHLLDGLYDPRTPPTPPPTPNLTLAWTSNLMTTQNLRDRRPPSQAGKGHPPGYRSLHRGRGIFLLQPQNPACCQLGPIGVLLLPSVMQINHVHMPSQESPVPAPIGIRVLHWGLPPTCRHPD